MTVVMRSGNAAMRRTQEQKAETRQNIVEAAGRLFRQHGIDAVGVDAIMHAAGLTHGGFYGHFPSKEALVAEVAAASLARAAARWEQIVGEEPPDVALRRIVGSYLDPAHVAELDHGCVLTTLGPEVARRPEARPGIAASVRAMAEALRRCLPSGDQTQALAALSTMVGAVVLARLADSPELAEGILGAAVEYAAPGAGERPL
jgi:TetR/AcrR family transcriptional regulator, transcriptional repressor for nem operon